MSDRAEEIARKIVRETTDDGEAFALLEHRIADALRAYAEEAVEQAKDAAMADVAMMIEIARRDELTKCGRVLFGLADEFDALAAGQIGNEIIHGALTDKMCFVRNIAATLGCIEETPPCAT